MPFPNLLVEPFTTPIPSTKAKYEAAKLFQYGCAQVGTAKISNKLLDAMRDSVPTAILFAPGLISVALSPYGRRDFELLI